MKKKSLISLLLVACIASSSFTWLSGCVKTPPNSTPGHEIYQTDPSETYSDVDIVVHSASGIKLLEGTNTVTHSKSYIGGEVITFTSNGDNHMIIQVDEFVGIPTVNGSKITYTPSMVYAPEGFYKFTIPSPSDSSYDARAFKSESCTITARGATASEKAKYRNVAVNPIDQRPDENYFPHVLASSTNPNLPKNEGRVAVDGLKTKKADDSFPNQSWKGTGIASTEFSVLLGRAVEVDSVKFNLGNHAFSKATLEFSNGTEVAVNLKGTTTTVKFSKRVVNWVRLKNMNGTGNYFSMTEFEVFGKDVAAENEALPSSEALVDMAVKLNEKYITANLNLGDNGWQNGVYWTGLIELYYMTGDENYLDLAKRWAGNYNYKLYGSNHSDPDNYHCLATYIDLINIDPSLKDGTQFDASVTTVRNHAYGSDTSGTSALSHWGWDDLLYMGLQVYVKLFKMTGDETYLEKMNKFFDYQKYTLGFYDEETGLWWRDPNYVPPSGASSTSPNGKNVYWARGVGWVIAGLAKVLQDLPDDNDHREDYINTFIDLADGLVNCQQSDGFWRQNLADPDHAPGPETSGTLFFLYGLAWGINNGILEGDKYYNSLLKGFNAVNGNAIHPDGYIGRVQPADKEPDPSDDIGYNITENYAYGMAILMLSELSKLSGGVTGSDLRPALDRKMVSATAIQVNSAYSVAGSKVEPLVEGNTSLKTIDEGGTVYLPAAFITKNYNVTPSTTTVKNGAPYVSVENAATAIGRKVFKDGDTIVFSYQERLFNPVTEKNLLDLLAKGLTDGEYPARPARQPLRYDFGDNDTTISGWGNDGKFISANTMRALFFDSETTSSNTTSVSFDITPRSTIIDANIALAPKEHVSNTLNKFPIAFRLYTVHGVFQVYHGVGSFPWDRTMLRYQKNMKYNIRVDVDFTNKYYDIYVTDSYGEEFKITNKHAFSSTITEDPTNIGKISIQDSGRWGKSGQLILENVSVNGTSREIEIPEMPSLASPDYSENFESYSVGNIAAGTLSGNVVYNSFNASSTAEIKQDGNNKYFRIMGEGSADPIAVFGFATQTSGKVAVSVDFLPDATVSSTNFGIKSSSGQNALTFIKVGNDDDMAIRPNTGASHLDTVPFEAGRWYNVVILFDIDNKAYDLWVDGEYWVTYDFRDPAATNIASVYLSGSNAGSGYGSIDNIKVKYNVA